MKNSVNLNTAEHQPLALSILVDAKDHPLGIFLPLEEWPKLRADINPENPLYKLMANLTFIPFHEMSLEEQSLVLEEKVRDAQMTNLEKGSFISYRNELCTSPDLFINEYGDRKELVSVDAKTGKITLIKLLE
ncbi:hypothetical protein [Pedobacter nanyangensis]|uniref:hypothetical protein n=1 Tax=Pedobacter nanyangensis TaxID=1562389 RepID=UPI000DE438E3|nr:hypothetical protein [Pedobacter nanyangensis]